MSFLPTPKTATRLTSVLRRAVLSTKISKSSSPRHPAELSGVDIYIEIV